MAIRIRRASLHLPLLALALAAGCAHSPRGAGSSSASDAFVGIGAVDVFVFTDIPHAMAQGMGVTSTELSEELKGRLRAAGVPSGGQGEGAAPVLRPNQVSLNLASLEVAPGQRAVWARVGLMRIVHFPGRDLPLAATVWERSGTALVRDGDATALKREIERLTAEFTREYRAAAPEMAAAR